MSIPSSDITQPSTLKTIQEMKERHARHIARAAALEKKLEEKTRFDYWHGKASARARLRDLLARQAASEEIRSVLDWSPLTPQEAAEMERLIQSFKAAPWNPITTPSDAIPVPPKI